MRGRDAFDEVFRIRVVGEGNLFAVGELWLVLGVVTDHRDLRARDRIGNEGERPAFLGDETQHELQRRFSEPHAVVPLDVRAAEVEAEGPPVPLQGSFQRLSHDLGRRASLEHGAASFELEQLHGRHHLHHEQDAAIVLGTLFDRSHDAVEDAFLELSGDPELTRGADAILRLHLAFVRHELERGCIRLAEGFVPAQSSDVEGDRRSIEQAELELQGGQRRRGGMAERRSRTRGVLVDAAATVAGLEHVLDEIETLGDRTRGHLDGCRSAEGRRLLARGLHRPLREIELLGAARTFARDVVRIFAERHRFFRRLDDPMRDLSVLHGDHEIHALVHRLSCVVDSLVEHGHAAAP